MCWREVERVGRYVVGMTGASGAAYGRRVVQALLAAGHRVDLIVTEAGKQVLAYELGFRGLHDPAATAAFFLPPGARPGAAEAFRLHDNRDLYTDLSSGTVPVDGVAFVPCSMDTVSALATGRSENLLERVGDVALKEGRRLVLVPRETPLSRIHLRNLLTLAESGAVILPAMPGFYHHPRSVEDLVDFIAGKVLNALGLPQDLFRPWQAEGRHRPGGGGPD